MRVVTNIDGVRKEFHSDEAFLKYAQQIYKENEEPSEIHGMPGMPEMPENTQQATEYIHEYCDNLTLTEK